LPGHHRADIWNRTSRQPGDFPDEVLEGGADGVINTLVGLLHHLWNQYDSVVVLLAEPGWLDAADKTIGQHWRKENARRSGVPEEELVDDKPAA